IPARVAPSFSLSRATSTTWAPADAMPAATGFPRPREAPVTIATLPFSENISSIAFLSACVASASCGAMQIAQAHLVDLAARQLDDLVHEDHVPRLLVAGNSRTAVIDQFFCGRGGAGPEHDDRHDR